ncbi:MAG: hypothetical protein DDT20_01752 [Firmicutes bacterium]|nr:hypothetical protein [Bacillota bacterium]
MATAHESKTLCLTAKRAETFVARFFGLMFRASLPLEQGLLLTPCRSVHTCFMRFSLDVVFLDADFRVVAIIERLPPWHLTMRQCRALHVLELAAGGAERLGMRCGDAVRIG